MNDEFPEAMGDPTHQRVFTYFSDAKADGFDCTSDKRAMSGNLGILPLTIGVGIGGKSLNRIQKANIILEHLRTNGLLSFTPGLCEDYLYATAVLECGTMWPYFGKTDDMESIVWWRGHGRTEKILAYGHIKHLTDQGSIPANEGKSTWWPSRADTYIKLLQNLPERADSNPIPIDTPADGDFTGIISGCFDDSVKRGYPIKESRLYNILLRIDQIHMAKDGQKTVYGSPVWVEQNNKLVSGLYLTRGSHEEISGLGIWNGLEWAYFFDKMENPVPFRANVPTPCKNDIVRIAYLPQHPDRTQFDTKGQDQGPPPGEESNPRNILHRFTKWLRKS